MGTSTKPKKPNHGGAGAGGAIKYKGATLHAAAASQKAPPTPLTAEQLAQQDMAAMAKKLAAAGPLAPTTEPDLTPKKIKGTQIIKDTQVYSNLAVAAEAAKAHVALANAARDKAITAGNSYTAAHALPIKAAHAQDMVQHTTEQQAHLENALHAAQQAVGHGMADNTEQHTPNTIGIKQTNAKAALANAKLKLAQAQPGYVAPTQAAPAPAAPAHVPFQPTGVPFQTNHTIKANVVVGKVANTTLPRAKLEALDGAGRIAAAQADRPSTTFHAFDNAATNHLNTGYIDNLKAQVQALNTPERAVVKAYTGSLYGAVNSYLYKQDTGANYNTAYGVAQTKVETKIKQLTKAIQKSALPTDALLYRGLNLPPTWSGMQAGDIIQHSNFGSASTHHDSSFHGNVKLEIEAPAGTKALFAQALSGIPGEREVLFQRGYKMLILSQTPAAHGGHSVWRVRIIQD